ncbi:MAG TPA: hypothetical protein VEG60_09440, partial [Candidatus Binatia bacterium]|nr:hypothetical protein [Candidatus Binatia bacterium]
IMITTMKAYINQELVKVEARVKAVTAKLDSLRQEQEEASAESKAAQDKLQVIDYTLASARSQLQEINRITTFTQIVLAAQNDDRRAFDQLEIWAKDTSFPMRKEAFAAYRTLMDNHALPMYFSRAVPWKEGVDPAKMNLADLRGIYESAPDSLKPALVEYTWKRDDIPKRQRMGFLAEVMTHDQSLRAVEYAGRFLSVALDAKLKPLAIKRLLKVWEEKKSTIH